MATTIPAVMALLQTSAAINKLGANWNPIPYSLEGAMTAAQRTTVITAILAGTVATEADALALIATAATGGISQKQVWDLMTVNPPTVG